MPTNIEIPALGESISEAVIAGWLKQDGDYVERDEELVELETDKVTMPLPSPVAGVLKIGNNAQEGDTVNIGDSIGTIDESAEKPAGAPAPTAEPPAAAQAAEPAPAAPTPPPTPAPAATPTTSAPTPASNGSALATPVAKKIAEEHNVNLAAVTPTGAGGRIREQDVLAAVQASQNGHAPNGQATSGPSASAAFSRGTSTERMSKLRQTIATQLVKAQQTAAMLTTFNECDMTNVMALRSRFKDQFLDTHGVKLGFMSFFAKAAVSALQKVPAVNSQITETDKGPATLHHDYCDIAFAVGTPKGLVVPVLRNVESLNFHEIEGGLMDLAKRARDGKLGLEDMQGGTFTVSNGGVYGSMMSTPILNPPQSGILGMHNIIKRPIESPDKPGEIALRPMMYLALSYDHRIVDGEGAVTFLKHIKECIENPERLLLGV